MSLVMNAGKKLLFKELKVGPTLTPGDYKQFDLCVPRGLQAVKMVSDPLCSRERLLLPRTQIKNHQSIDGRMLGKLPYCSFYLINIFPEFQTPYLFFP